MTITTTDDGNFLGAKCALFIGKQLLALRRDVKPMLLWPGALDLPGGGREPGEMCPQETVLREILEEVGLQLDEDVLCYAQRYEKPEGFVWFFAAHLPEGAESDIVFGNEGQGWALMDVEAFCDAPDVVPVFPERVRAYLSSRG